MLFTNHNNRHYLFYLIVLEFLNNYKISKFYNDNIKYKSILDLNLTL